MSHATERRGRRLRATIVLSALLATAGLVWGISTAIAASSSPTPALLGASGSPSPAASATPLTLRLGTTFDADNLNPFIGYSGTSYEIFHLNYDFLVGYAPDLSPRPELATSWTTSPDGKTWTFQLRQGVKWQDGQPFTSADVAFTYNLIIKNNLTAFTSYTNNIIKVVPQGDFAVQMICAKPKANMLRLWIPILPQHVWAKVPVASLTTSYINKPPIIGTGPFQTDRGQEGRVRQDGQEPGLLGQGQADDRRARDADLPERRHDDPGPQDGRTGLRHGHPDGPVRGPQEPAGRHRQRGRHQVLRRSLHELLRQLELARQSRAARSQVPPSHQLGGGQAEDRRLRLRRLRQGRPGHHHAGRADLLLDASAGHHLRLRSRQGRPDAGRRRLPAQERRPRQQAGQADRAASLGALGRRAQPELRQAHHRLVPQSRASRSPTRSSTPAR